MSTAFGAATCAAAGATLVEALHATASPSPPWMLLLALTLLLAAAAAQRSWRRARIVRHLAEASSEIAEGEMAGAIPLPKRGQLSVLVGAFNEVVIVLAKVMKVVDRMAQGDFSTTVVPRSERDRIAQAFVRMTSDVSDHIRRIQACGIQINGSLNEIAATGKEQHATAVETAATTTQVIATSRLIAGTAKELERTIADIAGTAADAARLAGEGGLALAQLDASIQQVVDAAAAITGGIEALSHKAGGISAVVTTINKVAEQTSLLSLNAAIEAEKAGEYGRGFSVVATEIRRLADQTSVSIVDIERIVREIQGAVAGSVTRLERFTDQSRQGASSVRSVSEQLSRIIDQAHSLAPRIGEVSEGMSAQVAGADQITQALDQLGEGARQTVESLRQSSQAIDALQDVGGQLREAVGRFRILG